MPTQSAPPKSDVRTRQVRPSIAAVQGTVIIQATTMMTISFTARFRKSFRETLMNRCSTFTQPSPQKTQQREMPVASPGVPSVAMAEKVFCFE